MRSKRFTLGDLADAEQTNSIFVADLRFAEQKKYLRLPALSIYNGFFCKWCVVFAPQTVSRSAKPPGSIVSGPHCNYKKAKEHYKYNNVDETVTSETETWLKFRDETETLS